MADDYNPYDDEELLRRYSDTLPGAATDPYEKPAQAPTDKYRETAIRERDALIASGKTPLGEGRTDLAANSAAFGWGDEFAAGATVPLEMIKRGTWNPAEAYQYSIAAKRLAQEKARELPGATAAEIVGGFGGASGTLRAGAGALKNIGVGGLMGGVAGAGEGEGVLDTAVKGAAGAGIGAGLTGGIQAAARTPSFIQNVFRPDANERVASAVRSSGVTPNEIVRRVESAAQAGQPEYTVADAMGLSGQRMLSGVARQPGSARELIAETLTGRTAGQADRLTEEIGQSLGVQGTARQAQDALTTQARTASRPLYEAAEQQQPVWTNRLQSFFDDPVLKQGLKEGVEVQRLESLAANRPFNPSDYAIVDFDKAGNPVLGAVPNMRTINLAKIGLDEILEKYRDPVTQRLNLDARGRAVDQVRRAFLAEVDALNPTYRQARAAYAGPASVREAVDTGKDAFRERAADFLPRFEGMGPTQQQGVRIGVADTLADKLERSRGTTGTLPAELLSPRGNALLDRMSLYQGPRRPGEGDQLRQFIQREKTMADTAHQALGGSGTAQNIADIGDVSPGTMSRMIEGLRRPYQGALNLAEAGVERLQGAHGRASREAIARTLLANEMQASRAMQAVAEAERRRQMRGMRSGLIGRAATGAVIGGGF